MDIYNNNKKKYNTELMIELGEFIVGQKGAIAHKLTQFDYIDAVGLVHVQHVV